MKKKDTGDNEIVYDEDQKGIDIGLKKLKEKLKQSTTKQREYLDGWQRSRAELVNYKRDVSVMIQSARKHGQEDVLLSIIPSLDAFDMAIGAEAWEKVDPVWRQGIEYIHQQLLGLLNEYDVDVIADVGIMFDANIHESDDDGGDTIIEIIRKGYRKGENVLRPARVKLGNSDSNKNT